MKLTIFDVEHGACALLVTDNGMRMLIDAGHNSSTGWRPGDYLRSQSVEQLEMLVVTNYDEDHVSGLPNLREQIKVLWLWRNGTVSPNDIRNLKSETGIGLGIESLIQMAETYTGTNSPSQPPIFPGVDAQVFCHAYPKFDDENNLSLVLFLRVNGTNFLFPGDLEKKGWLQLLATDARFREAVQSTNVLIASHHGRESGICEEAFDVYGCKPYWVVISDQGYQFDTQKTVPFYSSKARGGVFRGNTRQVLTTRNDGAITFSFWDGGWSAT